MKTIWLMVCAGALVSCGCSNKEPTVIGMPELDPSQAAQRALAQYDANGDGMLDPEELAKCPPLLAELAVFDANQDELLSREEISNRLASYLAGNAGLMDVVCNVTLDGLPLAGATVAFVPEKFLGPNIKPARGVSDARGYVRLRTEGYDVPGIHFGLFRVEVTLERSGQETIPERYHAETILGREIALDRMGREGIHLKLASQKE